MVTVLLPLDGLKVYPAEATMVEKVDPSVLPWTDSVSVLVAQSVEAGSFSTAWFTEVAEPRSICAHCGNAPDASQ